MSRRPAGPGRRQSVRRHLARCGLTGCGLTGCGLVLAALGGCSAAPAEDVSAQAAYLGVSGFLGLVEVEALTGLQQDTLDLRYAAQPGSGPSGTLDIAGTRSVGEAITVDLEIAMEELSVGPWEDLDGHDWWLGYTTLDGDPLTATLSCPTDEGGDCRHTVAGVVLVEGDLRGEVVLDLELTGEVVSSGRRGGAGEIVGRRQDWRPESEVRTGTATSDYGVFDLGG